MSGSSGLVGSAVCREFHRMGFRVVGLDNDLRSYFFGPEASTRQVGQALVAELPNMVQENIDIRDRDSLHRVFSREGERIAAIIHTAAQPSHDWASTEPFTDFEVNATGTLNLLENTLQFSPNAIFVFMSTNKVYGDLPNKFDYLESDTRFEPAPGHPHMTGFPENLPVDQSLHSLFGVSKLSADLLVQEYGRYFGMKTAVLRGGCLTGKTHQGSELHGFLSFLVKTAKKSGDYKVFGYGGKQVRDNIASEDVASAISEMVVSGIKVPGVVYNLGGEEDNVSILEVVHYLKEVHDLSFNVFFGGPARRGDHMWYVSDMSKFRADFPSWTKTKSVWELVDEMVSYQSP